MEMNMTINVLNLNWLQERINTYNKKALKLNVEPLELKIGKEYYKEKNKIVTKVVDISFNAEPIIFDKGVIVAKLEHISNLIDGNETKFNLYSSSVLKEFSMDQLKKINCNCEHCNTKRKRKYTYLIQLNDTKKIIQVGKSCMKEYTSIYNIDSVLSLYDMLEDIEIQLRKNVLFAEKEKEYYPITNVIKVINDTIKEYGYTSMKQVYEGSNKIATKNIVMEKILNEHALEKLNEKIYHKEEKSLIALEKIQEKIDYIKNYNYEKYILNGKYKGLEKNIKEEKFNESFEFKLLQLVGNDYCDICKDISVLSAFFIGYNSLVELKEKIDLKEKNISESEYFGNIKEKIEIEAEYKNTFNYQACFNGCVTTQYIHTFKKNNYTLVWKTSKDIDFEVGQVINLKGTIKEHKEYKEIKQTILTRCKIA